jgi:hypothetical protein
MWRFCPITDCIIITDPRNGGPNEIYSGGCRYWRKNNKVYRPNDMPSRIRPDGLKVWTDENGNIHRENGPARKNGDYEVFFFHGVKYQPISTKYTSISQYSDE